MDAQKVAAIAIRPGKRLLRAVAATSHLVLQSGEAAAWCCDAARCHLAPSFQGLGHVGLWLAERIASDTLQQQTLQQHGRQCIALTADHTLALGPNPERTLRSTCAPSHRR
jgi:hypothetical protein